MKFSIALALLSIASLVAAAPCSSEEHTFNLSNYDENHHNHHKSTKSTGDVGTKEDFNSGLLSGLLGDTDILTTKNTYNTVIQEDAGSF